MIERGTIVMRDGLIVAVGANVPVPADARVWAGDSLTVYPGLIDAYVLPAEARRPARARADRAARRGRRAAAAEPARGAASPLAVVRAEYRMIENLALVRATSSTRCARAGFTVAQVAPRARRRARHERGGRPGRRPARTATRSCADAAQVVALQPQTPGLSRAR